MAPKNIEVNQMSKIKANKTPGNNDIFMKTLKITLKHLFNMCLIKNSISSEWNNAVIILFHTKRQIRSQKNLIN